MISRKLIVSLTFAALALPVVLVVMGATAVLLSSMGDELGANVLGYVALALGILWLANLVLLIVAQAIRSVERDEPHEFEE